MGKLKKESNPTNKKLKRSIKNNCATKILFSKNESTVTIKSIAKKDKRKNKQKLFRKKIGLIKKQKQEDILCKKREKTIITGDLKPLKDALPSLAELFQLKRDQIKTGFEEKAAKDETLSETKTKIKKDKIKLKRKNLVNRYLHLQGLMDNKDFKKNPRETISEHIKVTLGLI